MIHASVVLWGFTPILGRAININALALVWFRLLIAVAALILIVRPFRREDWPSKMLTLKVAGVGCLVMLHWLAFYGSIKLANASVAVVCLAIAPFFTSILEPLVTRRSFRPSELWLAVPVIPGVLLIVGGVPTSMTAGVWLGVIAAVLSATFAVLNKSLTSLMKPMTMTLIELGSGFVLLTPILLVAGSISPAQGFQVPSEMDWLLLSVLSLLCTVVPFAMSLKALQTESAYTLQLAVNLEPVYAVLLAMWLFHEHRELGWPFYLGMLLVTGSVFVQPWVERRGKRPLES